MFDASYFWLTIGLLFLIIAFTRALPFIFTKTLKSNVTLQMIGRHLPAYIMMLLVIYEVGIKSFMSPPFALLAVIALLVVVVIQLWKRQLLLSLLVGVIAYVLNNHIAG